MTHIFNADAPVMYGACQGYQKPLSEIDINPLVQSTPHFPLNKVIPSKMRIRDLGYSPGKLPTGPKNSILDVKGVSVGATTIHQGTDVHTGVTVILPRPEHELQKPCYAGVHALNGAGELTGSFQIKEWGWTNTALAMTNSVALGKVYDAIWHRSFKTSIERGQSEHELIKNYGAPVVGETCDWSLE